MRDDIPLLNEDELAILRLLHEEGKGGVGPGFGRMETPAAAARLGWDEDRLFRALSYLAAQQLVAAPHAFPPSGERKHSGMYITGEGERIMRELVGPDRGARRIVSERNSERNPPR